MEHKVEHNHMLLAIALVEMVAIVVLIAVLAIGSSRVSEMKDGLIHGFDTKSLNGVYQVADEFRDPERPSSISEVSLLFEEKQEDCEWQAWGDDGADSADWQTMRGRIVQTDQPNEYELVATTGDSVGTIQVLYAYQRDTFIKMTYGEEDVILKQVGNVPMFQLPS